MPTAEIIRAVLADYWPSFFLLYLSAGVMLAAATFLSDARGIGYESLQSHGPASVCLVFGLAALWPVVIALRGLIGLTGAILRRTR